MSSQKEGNNSNLPGYGSPQTKRLTFSKRRKLNNEDSESSTIEINSSSSENDGDGTSGFNESNQPYNSHKRINNENSANDSFDLFLPSRLGRHTHPLISSASDNVFKTNTSKVIKKSNSFLEKPSVGSKQCPVCLTTYDNLCIHLKSCAKRNQESFNKLGVTLAFEEEPTEEENAADPFRFVGRTKNADKMFERDIQRAIKLSLEDSNSICGDPSSKKGVDEKNVAVKKSEPKWTGKMNKLSGKPLLLRRTKEERQNIITEKVAIVLMNSNKTSETTFKSEDFSLKSSSLRHCLSQEALLWKKSRLSPSHVKDEDYYIPSMAAFSRTDCGSPKEELKDEKQQSESEPIV